MPSGGGSDSPDRDAPATVSGGDLSLERARAFVDELARIGVRHACVAPGSRSTPLVLAVSSDDRIRVHVHLDERSAGFFALGIGKATGRTAAVITTSGTALANLHPAVVEADQSRAPLLLLTADRPRRLRGTDANQTVDQQRIFGRSARAFLEAPPDSEPDPDHRHLRALAARAEWATRGLPPGPVQVNFPFDKPLEPGSPDALDTGEPAPGGRPDGAPYTAVAETRPAASEDTVVRLARRLARAERPLVVAGPLPRAGVAGPAAIRLARAAGAPLLADPLSGARFGPGAAEVGVAGYDLLLGRSGGPGLPDPDLILRLGPAPTSAAVQDFCAGRSGVPQVVVDPGGRWMDHAAVVSDYLHAEPGLLCEAVAGRLEANPPERDEWPRNWALAGKRAGEAIVGSVLEGPFFEGTVLHLLAAELPEGATLVVGSSMPVRDLDAFGLPRDEQLRVLANRGASGIDGFASTALGAAAAGPGPVVAVCGDLSFYHDMNGLLAARDHEGDVTFVVINNDGGGIFHMLPIREFEPPFTRLFATPHGLDFGRAAALYDLPHRRVDGEQDLASALSGMGRTGPGVRILEVMSRREENRDRRERVARRVRDAVSGPAGA